MVYELGGKDLGVNRWQLFAYQKGKAHSRGETLLNERRLRKNEGNLVMELKNQQRPQGGLHQGISLRGTYCFFRLRGNSWGRKFFVKRIP